MYPINIFTIIYLLLYILYMEFFNQLEIDEFFIFSHILVLVLYIVN